MSTTYVNTINTNPIFADRATKDASGNDIQSTYAHDSALSSYALSADVSAYRVVSSTATQLYAGTAYLTSVNSAQISAARAGNAANASLATSAYYDGTGRLISALPDSAAVSAIASAYQVVTATGSAAVGYGLGAETAVSSINGSALLPYGYSSLSANSASWNAGRAIVAAYSADWNAVYNTVSSNSASWGGGGGGGGGGSVVSPSGTIYVSGSNIEGTNSAVLTANGEGFETVLYAQNTHLGPYMQVLSYGTVPGTGATLMMPFWHAASNDIRVILSGRDGDYLYTSASGTIPSGTQTASIPLDAIVSDISASAEFDLDLSNTQITAKKDGGILVTGVGELAWKSSVDNVTNTVAMHSAEWGQGMSPYTVSSIASSYARSAASSKLDTTAFGAVSGTFLTAHQDLSDYQTVAAMTSYALSSDVSGAVDLVSTQSANWGGSALALSAGPGIVLTMVGNTLVISTAGV